MVSLHCISFHSLRADDSRRREGLSRDGADVDESELEKRETQWWNLNDSICTKKLTSTVYGEGRSRSWGHSIQRTDLLLPALSTVEDSGIIEIPLSLCAQFPTSSGFEWGCIGSGTGSSKLPSCLNSLSEVVKNFDGRIPRDTSVAVSLDR